MTEYKYTAINLENEKITGHFTAQDEADLAEQLSKQGLYLVSAKAYTGKTPSAFFTTGTGGVNMTELNTFCRQFSIMINAGISIVETLDLLKEQAFSTYFKSLLEVITEDVKGGMMFSDALNKHKSVFPGFFCSMIKVGEASGKLDEVMVSLADYYEKDTALRKKTKSAFAYPIMLMCLAVGIVILMITYVVPTFREALADLEINPTGITKIVYDLSDFVLANGLYMLAGVIVIALAAIIFGMTSTGKYSYDWLKVNMPIFKKITIDMVTARFARGFGLLISSGMDITEALDSISIVFGNLVLEERFNKAATEVKQGMGLALSLNANKVFPPMLTQMIAVGERTNSLDEILSRTCNYFDTQVEDTLNSIVGKIQPILLICIGAIVGVLFIAVYSPMLEIMTQL